MLEGLNTIPWAELSHAYGSAEDVPEILQALISEDEGTRHGAIYKLFSHIYHQGSIYSASAYATPFLIEILAHEKTHDKQEILSLLAHMAIGSSHIHRHLPLHQQEQNKQFFAPENLYGPDYQQKMDEELFWVSKTHDAIAEGADLYFSLLQHTDHQIKMHAATLLANLPSCSECAIPLFHSLFEIEEDESIKANFLFTLHTIDPQSETSYQFFKQLALESENLLLKFIATLAVADSGRDEIPYEAINLLIEVATEKQIIDKEIYKSIVASEWSAPTKAFSALRKLKHQQASFAIQQLIPAFQAALAQFEKETGYDLQQYNNAQEILRAMPYPSNFDDNLKAIDEQLPFNIKRYSYPVIMLTEEVCRTLIALAFGKEPLASGTRFHEIAPEQQFVLTTLLHCNLAWHRTGSYMDFATMTSKETIGCVADLSCIGLPSRNLLDSPQREGLRAFIEKGEGSGEWLERESRIWKEKTQEHLQKHRANSQRSYYNKFITRSFRVVNQYPDDNEED